MEAEKTATHSHTHTLTHTHTYTHTHLHTFGGRRVVVTRRISSRISSSASSGFCFTVDSIELVSQMRRIRWVKLGERIRQNCGFNHIASLIKEKESTQNINGDGKETGRGIHVMYIYKCIFIYLFKLVAGVSRLVLGGFLCWGNFGFS